MSERTLAFESDCERQRQGSTIRGDYDAAEWGALRRRWICRERM